MSWRGIDLKTGELKSSLYRAQHQDERQAYNKKYQAEHGLKNNLKRRYNLSVDAYNQMLTVQNGVCAICGRLPHKRLLSVDHDHSSGKIRGLLCHRCNNALASFEHNTEKFLSYLAQFKEEN